MHSPRSQLSSRLPRITLLFSLSLALEPLSRSWAALPSVPRVEYELLLDTATRGYDGVQHWVHPRAGIVPRGEGRSPEVVLTMTRALVYGSDIYHELAVMRSRNLGRTWLGPVPQRETLGRRQETAGMVATVGDFWPQWHAASGKLLGTGHTVRYSKAPNGLDVVTREASRQTAYSVYDPTTGTWSPWATAEMPDSGDFRYCGAGSTQRVDLANGDILLPMYGSTRTGPDFFALVSRCSFDGSTLRVQEVGPKLEIKGGRGFTEPSLVHFRGRYLLTLRNDDDAYVAVSADGLRFGSPKPWTWEDGTTLASYNTQQHWVRHGDNALFLVYTRRNASTGFPYTKKTPAGTYLPDDPLRGGSNDHMVRHRAPLYIAQINPDTLTVMRSTERILVPERGARVCNFGVTEISPDETWVTVSEWMQRERTPERTPGDFIIPVDNPRGADNSVYYARICWRTPSLVQRP